MRATGSGFIPGRVARESTLRKATCGAPTSGYLALSFKVADPRIWFHNHDFCASAMPPYAAASKGPPISRAMRCTVPVPFGNAFKDACKAAELHKRSAHGCRKIAATRAAEAGATVAELNAIFWLEGHWQWPRSTLRLLTGNA
jgi:hypothetical protein